MRYLAAITLALAAANAFAQETYESAQIATEELNGTARYVGMGGAMDALGGDISTISTNPAGIGLFRRSWAGASFGPNILPAHKGYDDTGKTVVSFNQIGFVYSNALGDEGDSYINVAVNYHKARDFNQIIPAVDYLDGSSLTRQSFIGNNNDWEYTQFDELLDATIMKDSKYGPLMYMSGSVYAYERKQSGYTSVFDFNLSGNYHNRLFWGLTLGIKDVHYESWTSYTEAVVNKTNIDCGDITLEDTRHITGTGFNIIGGLIYRPIEDSPFRIGLSISTPTWYRLETRNYTTLFNNTLDPNTGSFFGMNKAAEIDAKNEYKCYTPWKFGLSLGHTIGNNVALGASYEYADYEAIDNRVITDRYYDSYDNLQTPSDPDFAMNDNTKFSLKGVHTLKLGAEFKVSPEVAFRLGYNYVSPMYKSKGIRDFSLPCPGTSFASTADYINWKATNRFTAGIGYSNSNFNIDLSYAYSMQEGDFYPFMGTGSENSKDEEGFIANPVNATNVKNNRHHLNLSIGFRF